MTLEIHIGRKASAEWGIAAVAFVGGVGGGVVFPILPVVGMDLGMSGLMIGLILAANRLARLGFNPITGSLIDRFGTRWPVAAGLAVEAFGTLAFSLGLTTDAPSAWFLVGRVIWGIGSSLLLVGALAAVIAIAPVKRRGRMTARVRTALSLGLPAGLVIGGVVADRVSAGAAFLTATGLSIAGAVAAVLLLPAAGRREKRPTSAQARRLDGWRNLLHIPALPTIWIANALLFFSVSGVLLASLAVMVDQRSLYLLSFGAEGSAGLYMAAMMTARGGAALASGRYLDRMAGRTRPLIPAAIMLAVGFVGLGSAERVATVILFLLLVGAGAGTLTIPLLTVLGDVSPPHLHGRILSVYQWAADLGGAVGPIAGLELGQRYGFNAIYAGVGLILLTLVIPLRGLMITRSHS